MIGTRYIGGNRRLSVKRKLSRSWLLETKRKQTWATASREAKYLVHQSLFSSSSSSKSRLCFLRLLASVFSFLVIAAKRDLVPIPYKNKKALFNFILILKCVSFVCDKFDIKIQICKKKDKKIAKLLVSTLSNWT